MNNEWIHFFLVLYLQANSHLRLPAFGCSGMAEIWVASTFCAIFLTNVVGLLMAGLDSWKVAWTQPFSPRYREKKNYWFLSSFFLFLLKKENKPNLFCAIFELLYFKALGSASCLQSFFNLELHHCLLCVSYEEKSLAITHNGWPAALGLALTLEISPSGDQLVIGEMTWFAWILRS